MQMFRHNNIRNLATSKNDADIIWVIYHIWISQRTHPECIKTVGILGPRNELFKNILQTLLRCPSSTQSPFDLNYIVKEEHGNASGDRVVGLSSKIANSIFVIASWLACLCSLYLMAMNPCAPKMRFAHEFTAASHDTYIFRYMGWSGSSGS